MKIRRLWILAVAVFIVGAGPLLSRTWAAEDIMIGIITPMSGPAADFGASAREGADVMMAEINKEGGVLGRKLKAIYRDDESNPQKGVSAAMELVSGKKADVIMGGMSTPVAMAISPIINDAKMIFMVLGTGTPLTSLSKYPYNFRMKYFTEQEAKAIADYALKRRGFKKVGLVADTSGYGKTGKEDLLTALKSHGVEPVGVEQYNWGDTDMTGQLLRLRKAGAEVLVAWGMGQDIAQLARNAQKIAWDVQGIGSSGICQLDFGQLSGEAGKLWFGTMYKRVSYTEQEKISKKIMDWIDKLEKQYGKNRKTLVPDTMTWADQIMIYANAVKRAGTTDSERVKAQLEATNDFEGYLSSYSFSSKNHDGMRLENLSIVYPATVERNCIYKRAPNAP